MARLKEQYVNEIAPALNKKFGYKSVMQIPKLDKVIVNVGCGDSKNNAKEIEAICKDIAAITGQNAISQAKEFCKAADATGIILTQLDGTAKGGCVVAVKQRLGLPVRFIGVGEGIDDLIPFTPEGFVEELIPRTGWKH